MSPREDIEARVHGVLSALDRLKADTRTSPDLLLESAAELIEAREMLSDILAQLAHERAA